MVAPELQLLNESIKKMLICISEQFKDWDNFQRGKKVIQQTGVRSGVFLSWSSRPRSFRLKLLAVDVSDITGWRC